MFPCLYFLLYFFAEPQFAMQPRTCDDHWPPRYQDRWIDRWSPTEETAGMSDSTSKRLVTCSWDEVPHLSERAKQDMLKTYPPHMRDARSRGVPMLGSGAIYPVTEADIVCDDFAIPPHWKRCFGMDPGWNFTAGCWLAQDPDSAALYVYSVYKQQKAEPSVHAAGMKSRGDWIPGVIDPASAGSGQADGRRLIDLYAKLGMNLSPADNSVEAGLYKCWELLSSGQLKVFKSCAPWFQEYRNYARDEKGRVVKKDDHIMDAMRYAVMSGLARACSKPVANKQDRKTDYVRGPGSWMG